ncbi:efflux transporter periplasmic adaptor subunit [Marinobacter fuscus]|uniref:Efflux transporter periplasmic adaptor subunit n=1 Tax=Marinobacter fuscus TaxID=2109942 RepID=A0A2T1KC78_9GAMM|nr:HlyD family efflux transporter periplasmic adaptor subunit [Marinobacter fuscus]PSF07152.1 efflux transporter periplasmic adaptor subunit [Marinobacter fuscus]
MTRKNKLTLALALIAGIAFVVIMVKLKQPPERVEAQATATPVRIMEVTPREFRTEARGYGQVLPARSWNTVANVGGRVVWKHPELESGNIISEGTRLLEIDPTRYELAEASARADLAGIEAELRQLDQEERNTGELLKLEERRLTLARRELDRAETLVARGALSQTRYEEQQRATLQQEQAVQTLRNQQNLIPARRETLQARMARTESALASAREDLDDTRFEAPWDLRVHQADIDTGQHVSPGQTLFIADDITRAEATVQLEVAELRRVLSQLSGGSLPETGSNNRFADFHDQLPLDDLNIRVTPTNVPDAHWPGKLTRVTSSLNQATRTVQAVISVDEPYRNANPPARPPLVRNMFVQASITAQTPEPVIVIPASAVHQGVVYLADDDNRLQRQPVSVAWQQGEDVVIDKGLAPGDRLVLDDLVPAIDGTLLAPGDQP